MRAGKKEARKKKAEKTAQEGVVAQKPATRKKKKSSSSNSLASGKKNRKRKILQEAASTRESPKKPTLARQCDASGSEAPVEVSMEQVKPNKKGRAKANKPLDDSANAKAKPKAKAKGQAKKKAKKPTIDYEDDLLWDEKMQETLNEFVAQIKPEVNVKNRKFKDNIRSQLHPFLQVKLIIYWTRGACGVRVRGEAKDTHHFSFNSCWATPAQKVVVAVKCAELAVTSLNWVSLMKGHNCVLSPHVCS